MRKLLLSAVALAAMGSMAWADSPAPESKTGPVALTDAQMETVTAGLGFVFPHRKGGGFDINKAYVSQYAYSANNSHAAAIGLCAHCAVGNSVWQSSTATNSAVVTQF